MKKIILSIIFLASGSMFAYSQEIVTTQDTTVVAVKPPLLDSTLLNRNVFSIIRESGPFRNTVTIEQSSSIESLLVIN